MDDRSLRIATLVAAHLIFLSAAALRIRRGHRERRVEAESPFAVQWYPPLVWLPFLVAYFEPLAVDLDRSLRYAGVAIAWLAGLFGAWGMWSLGRDYGIRMDVYVGHSLRTGGPFAIVRHPMYLGIVAFHAGASLSLASPLLLALTVLVILPLTAMRIVSEEKVLVAAFGDDYVRYQQRVGALLPRP